MFDTFAGFRRTSIVFALLFLAACSEPDGKKEVTVVREKQVTGMRIVSGDGQVAQVRPAPLFGAASDEDVVLPEPFVAQLVLEDAGTSASVMEITGPGGPARQTAPAESGWEVRWDTAPEGCGQSVEPVTLIPDAAQPASNQQAVGTRATECTVRAAALRQGVEMYSVTFAYTLRPGPPVLGSFYDGFHPEAVSSITIPAAAVADGHRNLIPFRVETPADSAVWAGGGALGTTEARTFHFPPATGERRTGKFFLLGEDGAPVASVLYILFADGGAEYTVYPGNTR